MNVYYRLKVIRTLKILRQKNIQFDADMVYNEKKLQSLLADSPADSKQSISDFAKYIRYSMVMAILLILLITLFGGVLMYFRKNG